MQRFFLSVFCVVVNTITYAQQLSFSDAAQAYNRLIIEKNNGSYMRINNYKVTGTPYLYGEKNKGDLFAKGETAHNIFLSYNTYNQEVEFYLLANQSKSLVKEANQIDSFILKLNASSGINEDLKFVSGEVLGSKDKSFYQLMYKGQKFDLYKKYKSTLGIVTTNYIQSELRQFDLAYEYFYLNVDTKELKKLKPTNASIIKEFKAVKDKDVAELLGKDNITASPDIVLMQIFAHLNN